MEKSLNLDAQGWRPGGDVWLRRIQEYHEGKRWQAELLPRRTLRRGCRSPPSLLTLKAVARE
ncbi:hypothetical protein E2C01_041513 [Portunus trituberculatus]|uniref:Uncharacterized protein n=1 Tax=Portunus trituberculatus TaxID=210409 RepID=A0A5B7FQK9_PORTR|nr:hypothetical protein [Portunus trituberculatus]